MTPDRATGQKHGPFTTWQWSVLGAYLVAILLSVVVGRIATQAVNNTERIDKSICSEIHYLEGVIRVSENPAAAKQLGGLVKDLRELTPGCPPNDES